MAEEPLEDPAAVGIKPAGKLAGLVYTKQIGLERAGNIVFCEGAPRQEKRVNGAIAGSVVTGYCAWVINASSFGKTHRIVRVDDRRAKATIAEPDKTARHRGRIDELANDVASFVNLLREGRISRPGIIKSRDHFDRTRVGCLLS